MLLPPLLLLLLHWTQGWLRALLMVAWALGGAFAKSSHKAAYLWHAHMSNCACLQQGKGLGMFKRHSIRGA